VSRLIPVKLLEVQLVTATAPGSRRSHKWLTESNPLLNTTQKGKNQWNWVVLGWAQSLHSPWEVQEGQALPGKPQAPELRSLCCRSMSRATGVVCKFSDAV